MKLTLSQLLLSGGLFALAFSAQAQMPKQIDLNTLAGYQLAFDKIDSVNLVAGNNLLAKVGEKTGANFSVFLPFGVQQVNYLVTNGEKVEASQAIAELKGYDVHHFLDEYEAAEQLFKQAEKQYLSSKILFKNKALKQSQWLEVNKNYYEAKLRFEHLNHYRGFLTVNEHEKIVIIAPTAGYVRHANSSASKLEGELLFDIIPSEAIRLTTNVPLANIEQLSQLNVLNSDCVLNIASKETIASRFVTKIWSTAINESKQCQFTLGQSLVVTPIYQQKALTVNKKAVFEFEDKNYIALKDQQKLTLVSINILSSSANHYHFTANADLANKSALISSVSAVQGILLNLGDE